MDSRKLFRTSDITTTRGHSLKLFKPSLKKNIGCGKNVFTQRVINIWNSLPQAIVDAKTFVRFKSKLDTHWKEEKIGYGVTKAMPN